MQSINLSWKNYSIFKLIVNELKQIVFEYYLWTCQNLVKRPILEFWWRKRCINTDLYRVLQHPGNNVLQNIASRLNARISVDLYQPRYEVLVNHEIIPVNFERMLAIGWIQSSYSLFRFRDHDSNSFQHDLLNFGKNLFPKVQLFFTFEQIQIVLELVVGDFISLLKLSIRFLLFLNRIIRQVNKLV